MRAFLISWNLIAWATFALAAGDSGATSKVGSATRRVCLLALSAVADTESTFKGLINSAQLVFFSPLGKVLKLTPENMATFTGRVYDPITKQYFGVTGRYLTTLSSLGLLSYDFHNKQIANIASGNSRLGQGLNLMYGSTGTNATSVDLYSNGVLFVKGKSNFLKGSAFDIPLPDKSQDLAISHWFLDYLDLKQATPFLNQMIRITKNGGEIRIGTYSPRRDAADLRQELLKDSRVESVDGFLSFPTGYLRIKLKD